MTNSKGRLLAGAMLVAVSGGVAQAQEAPEPEFEGVAEIVVTAQRRAEALQDVPMAISAVSAADLTERGLTDVRDVLAMTPGTSFTANNAAEPVLAIRGISSGGEGAASDSGVLMLIDGEVISRDFMRSAPIYDIERVEVLRGPQGTTYGRNASGGVFHVITRRPRDERGGQIRAEGGSYGALTLDAGVDLPLAEQTLSRLAVQYSRRDGFSEDVATGRDVDDRDALSGRLTLEQGFGDKVTTTVRLHGSRERHGDTAPLKSYDPTSPLLGPPFRPSFTEPSTDPYKVVTTPGGSFFDRDVWGVSNELVIDLGWGQLTSLTSYRDGDNHFFQSSPLGYNNVETRNNAEVFTQEVRLEGDAADSRLYWVAGLFYLDEDVTFGFDRATIAATVFGPTTQQLRQVSGGRGFGVFGEVNWDLTPELTLTVGGRYSHDKKDFSIDNRVQGPFAMAFIEDPSQPLIASVSDSWEKPTGRVSLQYRPSNAVMVYGALSQGYKSGGFNSEPTNVTAAVTPFEEETITNVELGLRSQFANDRVRLNLTAFDMRYKDIQVPAFTGNSIEVTRNAAKATVRGIEIEAVARPSRHLDLSVGYAAYDAEFDEYIDLNGNDLAGATLPKTPKWTLTTSAVVTSPTIADAGVLRFRADYMTRSDIAVDAPVDVDYGIRRGKDMVDLRLAWLPESDRWEVAVFVRNLLDKAEMQYIFPQGVLEQRLVAYGPPRTWGGSLSYKF